MVERRRNNNDDDEDNSNSSSSIVISEQERWFLMGSLSYAMTKIEEALMIESGTVCSDEEITNRVISNLDDVMVERFKQRPLTVDELERIAHVIKVTHRVIEEAFINRKW